MTTQRILFCRLKQSGNLDAIQIIKVQGGTLEESFLDEGNISRDVIINGFINYFYFISNFISSEMFSFYLQMVRKNIS